MILRLFIEYLIILVGAFLIGTLFRKLGAPPVLVLFLGFAWGLTIFMVFKKLWKVKKKP